MSSPFIPSPSSARRVRDDELADLARPTHYPVEAICLECGHAVQNERWLLSEWYHVSEEPGS